MNVVAATTEATKVAFVLGGSWVLVALVIAVAWVWSAMLKYDAEA